MNCRASKLCMMTMAVAVILGLSATLQADLTVRNSLLSPGHFAIDVGIEANTFIPLGSYFTIYDLDNFTGAIGVPADWSVSTTPPPIPPPPPPAPVVDNPLIPNITVTFTGPDKTYTKDTNLGRYTGTTSGNYNDNDFWLIGPIILNYPTPHYIPPTVPLPAASWMGLSLLGLLAATYALRRCRASREIN